MFDIVFSPECVNRFSWSCVSRVKSATDVFFPKPSALCHNTTVQLDCIERCATCMKIIVSSYNHKCLRMLIFTLIQIFRRGPMDNKSTLVKVMDWRRICNTPLPGPMMTHLNMIVAFKSGNVWVSFMRHLRIDATAAITRYANSHMVFVKTMMITKWRECPYCWYWCMITVCK